MFSIIEYKTVLTTTKNWDLVNLMKILPIVITSKVIIILQIRN